MSDKLDDILKKFNYAIYRNSYNYGAGKYDPDTFKRKDSDIKKTYNSKLKQSIQAWALDIVGEDEFYEITNPDDFHYGEMMAHPVNDYKAELRKQIRGE